MLPRLEAQREIASINAMTVAFGGMKPFDRQRYLGRLERMAKGASTAPVKATPEVLAAMGINVVIVPPGGSAKEPVDG